MFSWRQSSLSRSGTTLFPILLASSALGFVTPALARNRSHGQTRGSNHQSTRPAPSTPSTSDSSASVSTTKKSDANCPNTAMLTVATYNVENFWDDVDSNSGSATYNEFQKGGSNWYNDQMYKVKAQHVADAIRMAGSPDIIAMQEFESANNASRSLELLKPYVESMGYKYFALGQQNSNNPVAVTTAVISKFPIAKNDRLDFKVNESMFSASTLANESIASLNSSARDPQVVTIDVQGQPLRLYTAHWKSRRGQSDSGDVMRLAIAELIKNDINSQIATQPNLDVLVMGDFNSDYNERPLQEGMNSTDDRNVLKHDRTSDKMYNLWFELPSSERCSYMYNGELQCIDHMLTNANLFDGKGIDIVEDSFQVVGHNGGEAAQKLLRNDGRSPNRWGMQKNNGRSFFTGTGYSDHLPLVATFKIPSLCKVGK